MLCSLYLSLCSIRAGMHESRVFDQASRFLRQEHQHAVRRRRKLLRQQVCTGAVVYYYYYYCAENNTINHFIVWILSLSILKSFICSKHTVPKLQNYTVCYGHAVNTAIFPSSII